MADNYNPNTKKQSENSAFFPPTFFKDLLSLRKKVGKEPFDKGFVPLLSIVQALLDICRGGVSPPVLVLQEESLAKNLRFL